MKKIASILLFALLLNGCDDGDLSVDLINFEDITTTSSCTTDDTVLSTLIFKLKEKESLLLYVPKSIFAGEPNTVPKFYDIDLTTKRVIYRAYNGTILQDNICAVIPPASPNVVEEWIATSGLISVLTTPQMNDPDTANNSTRIKGYTYSIIFNNITFNKPSGPQTYETFPFGIYTVPVSPATLATPFLAANAGQCPESKQVYNFNAGESITIDNIDPTLIVNEVTAPDAPRTGLINDTTNKVIYRTYKGGVLTKDYFCNTIPPTNPLVVDTWAGVNGLAGQNGIIEVATTTFGTGFKHTITLKKVSLQKGSNVFKLGDTYVLGEIIK